MTPYQRRLWRVHLTAISIELRRIAAEHSQEAASMAVHDDGTRDCPRCVAAGKSMPRRVAAGNPLALCQACDHAARVDAQAGLAQLQPYLRKRLAFQQWLADHGQDAA